ncbi:unnamed protein product, partial [Ascophyllum nodosum]
SSLPRVTTRHSNRSSSNHRAPLSTTSNRRNNRHVHPQHQHQHQHHQTLPGGSLVPAGSPVAQGGSTQMVVPSYPPGSMPAQISAAATAVGGGGAPHHMTTVPPHLMGEAPRGPMQPQQYLQSVYQAVAMGHHPQQMYMQPPLAGMHMLMAPGLLQGYSHQG